MFIEESSKCPVASSEQHEPLITPNWTDEDDEIVSGTICRLCGEEI